MRIYSRSYFSWWHQCEALTFSCRTGLLFSMLTRKVCSPIEPPAIPLTVALTHAVQPNDARRGVEKLTFDTLAEGKKNSPILV
jgi:hypothetical protein